MDWTISAVYLLWVSDSYVDRDGSVESDILMGVFTHLEEVNKFLNENWFEFPCDPRGKEFAKDNSTIVFKGHEGNQITCYYEFTGLNRVK